MNKTLKTSDEELHNLRHSLAHLLAAAVMELWPDTKRTIGPSIENGFYFDFAFSKSITKTDLPKIEARMRKILPTWSMFERHELAPAEAKKEFPGNPYKHELIDEFAKKGEKITFYKSGSYWDLCRGGHVKNMKRVAPDCFRLTSVAGAYWHGDEKNPMLTRIYGVAFRTAKELHEHLEFLKEAERRDHRKLGAELKLFMTADMVGPGLPMWLPRGAILVEELEKLAKETEERAGYLRIRTPEIAKEQLFTTSGHLPYYAESMFPKMEMKEDAGTTTYYLRAMNCPHAHLVYAHEPRSYRDLPLRLAEYGTVYRYEKSGELFGLMRVRMMHMNDAHIYVTPEQFEKEFNAVNQMYLKYFKLFGLKQSVMRFSTHDPSELGKKYVDEPVLWKQTETMVRNVLKKSGINFIEVPNEAAFYGPKIDVQVWSSIGREFTIATNQVDFAQPRRFGLTYTDKDGKEKTPIVIHRAPLGTHERFIGFLIEHYAGDFPLWLSPVQVQIVPVGSRHVKPAEKIAKEFRGVGIRVDVDGANETVGYKIRKAVKMKVPYLLVMGDKEARATKLAVRVRGSDRIRTLTKKRFIEVLRDEIAKRK